MTKVTATLGRNFIKTKEFQEAQQLMGLEMVSKIMNKRVLVIQIKFFNYI